MTISASSVMEGTSTVRVSADHEAAADDGSFLALRIDAVELQDLHGGLRRAGREAHFCIGKHAGEGSVGAAIHVLFGRQHLPGLFAVQVFGQRPEHQDAVHALVVIQFFQCLKKCLAVHVRRQHHVLYRNAGLLGALHGAALVAQVVISFAHAEDSQRRHDALRLQRFASRF